MAESNKLFRVFFILFLCSFIIQLININFGLPRKYSFHGIKIADWFPDESKFIAKTQYFLTPKTKVFYDYAHPPLQSLFVSLILVPDRITNEKVPEPWLISLISRLISALSIAISSIFIYWIGRQFNKTAGFLASAFFIISPISAVVGKDFKSTALAGLLLLIAIYFAFKALEQPHSNKTYRNMGVSLGFSSMASFLSVLFIHLPLLSSIIANKTKYGTLFIKKSKDEKQIITKTGKIYIIGLLLILLLFAITLIMLMLQKERLFQFAEFIYSRLNHAKTFQYHLETINFISSQITKALLLAFIIGCLYFVYLRFRHRLFSLSILQYLKLWEISYINIFLVIVFVMMIATLLNFLTPVSYLMFVKMYLVEASAIGNAGKYGLYPGDTSAYGYFLSIFPYSIGLPLYMLSLIGLFYLLSKPNGKRILLFCTFIPFLLKLATWNEIYTASRYAFLSFYLFYLSAGILLGDMIHSNRKWLRALGIVVSIGVTAYTFAYTMSYLHSRQYHVDGRVKAAKWVVRNVPQGSNIAVKNDVDIPRNLGPLEILEGYKYVSLNENPEYCIIDGFEYHVIKQYFRLSSEGYIYSNSDWWPSRRPPNLVDFNVYSDILNEKKYELLVKITSDTPSAFGINFDHKLLIDPATYYHREFYVFKRKEI